MQQGYPIDTLAKYFSDLHGSYSVYSDPTGGSANKVLRQQADSVPPMCTHGRGASAYSTAIGGTEWSNYALKVAAKSEGNTSAASEFLMFGAYGGGSFTADPMPGGNIKPETFYHAPYVPKLAGVVLLLFMDGTWTLSTGSGTLAQGKNGGWRSQEWLQVELEVAWGAGDEGRATAVVNGVALADRVPTKLSVHHGPAWLGGGFHFASFDNFTTSIVV